MIGRNRTVASSDDDLRIKVSNQTNAFSDGKTTGSYRSYDYVDKEGDIIKWGSPAMLHRSFSDHNLEYNSRGGLPNNSRGDRPNNSRGDHLNNSRGDNPNNSKGGYPLNQELDMKPCGQRLPYSNTVYVAGPMQYVKVENMIQTPRKDEHSWNSGAHSPQMPYNSGAEILSRFPVLDNQHQILPNTGGQLSNRTSVEFNPETQQIPLKTSAVNISGTYTTLRPRVSNSSNDAASWSTVDLSIPPPKLPSKNEKYQLQAKDFVGQIYTGYGNMAQSLVNKDQKLQLQRDNSDFGDVDLRVCQLVDVDSKSSAQPTHEQMKDEDLRSEQRPEAHILAGNLSGRFGALSQVTMNQYIRPKEPLKEEMVSSMVKSENKGDENNNSWLPYSLDEINNNNFQSSELSGKMLNATTYEKDKYLNGSYRYIACNNSTAAVDTRETIVLESERRPKVARQAQMNNVTHLQPGMDAIDFTSLVVPPPPPLPETEPPAPPPLPETTPPPPPPHELIQNMKSQPCNIEPNLSIESKEPCLSDESINTNYQEKGDFVKYHFNMFLNPRNPTDDMNNIKSSDVKNKDINVKDRETDKSISKAGSCGSPFCEFWKEKVRAARDGVEDKLPNTFQEYAKETGVKNTKVKSVSKKYPDSSNKTKLPKWKLPGKNELNTDIIRVINAKLKRTKEFLEKRLKNPVVSEKDVKTANITNTKLKTVGKIASVDKYIDLTRDDMIDKASIAASKKVKMLNSTGSMVSKPKVSVAGISNQSMEGKNDKFKTKTAKAVYFRVGKDHKTLLKTHGYSGNKKEKMDSPKENETDDKVPVHGKGMMTNVLEVKNKENMIKKNLMKENVSGKVDTNNSLKIQTNTKISGAVQALRTKLPNNAITGVKCHKENIINRQGALKSPLLILEKCDINLGHRKRNYKEVEHENRKQADGFDLDSQAKRKGSQDINRNSLYNRKEKLNENTQPLESKEMSERSDDVTQNVLRAKRWLSYRADAIKKIQDSYTPHAVAKKPKRDADHPALETPSDRTSDKSSSKESVDQPDTVAVCKPIDKTSIDESSTNDTEKGILNMEKEAKSNSPVMPETCKEKASPVVKATTLTSVNPYTSYMNSPHTPAIPIDSSHSNVLNLKSWRTGPDIFSLDYLKSLGNFRTDFGVIEGKKNPNLVKSNPNLDEPNPNLVEPNPNLNEPNPNPAEPEPNTSVDDQVKEVGQMNVSSVTDKTPKLVICEDSPVDEIDTDRDMDFCEEKKSTHLCREEQDENGQNDENTEGVIKNALDDKVGMFKEEAQNIMEQSDIDTNKILFPGGKERNQKENFSVHPPFIALPLSNSKNLLKQNSNLKRWSEKEYSNMNDKPLFDPCFKRILRLPIDPLYKKEFIDPILNSTAFNDDVENPLVGETVVDDHYAGMLAEQAEPLDLSVKTIKSDKVFKEIIESSLEPIVKDACCQTANYEIGCFHYIRNNRDKADDIDMNNDTFGEDNDYGIFETDSKDKTIKPQRNNETLEGDSKDDSFELSAGRHEIFEVDMNNETSELHTCDKTVELDSTEKTFEFEINNETFELNNKDQTNKLESNNDLSDLGIKDTTFKIGTKYNTFDSKDERFEFDTNNETCELHTCDKTFELDANNKSFELEISNERFEQSTKGQTMDHESNNAVFEHDIKDDTSEHNTSKKDTFELEIGNENIDLYSSATLELDTNIELFEFATNNETFKWDSKNETCEFDTKSEIFELNTKDKAFGLDISNENIDLETNVKTFDDNTKPLDINNETFAYDPKDKKSEHDTKYSTFEHGLKDRKLEIDLNNEIFELETNEEILELNSNEKVDIYSETFELNNNDKEFELETSNENIELDTNGKTFELDSTDEQCDTKDKTLEDETLELDTNHETYDYNLKDNKYDYDIRYRTLKNGTKDKTLQPDTNYETFDSSEILECDFRGGTSDLDINHGLFDISINNKAFELDVYNDSSEQLINDQAAELKTSRKMFELDTNNETFEVDNNNETLELGVKENTFEFDTKDNTFDLDASSRKVEFGTNCNTLELDIEDDTYELNSDCNTLEHVTSNKEFNDDKPNHEIMEKVDTNKSMFETDTKVEKNEETSSNTSESSVFKVVPKAKVTDSPSNLESVNIESSPELPTLISKDDVDATLTGFQDELDNLSGKKWTIKKASPSLPVLLPIVPEENRTKCLDQVCMKNDCEKEIECLEKVTEVKTDEKTRWENYYSEVDTERKLREFENVITLNDQGSVPCSQIFNKQTADADQDYSHGTTHPIQDDSCFNDSINEAEKPIQNKIQETGKPIQDKNSHPRDSTHEAGKGIQDKSHCTMKTSRTEKGLFQSAEKFLTENFDATSKRKCRKRVSLYTETSSPQQTGSKKKMKLKRFAVTSPVISGREAESSVIDVVDKMDLTSPGIISGREVESSFIDGCSWEK